MKDPLLRRFLTDGWSGRITDDTIPSGFLDPDFALLDAIGHWVSTDKIMAVWSSHAMRIESYGYREFKEYFHGLHVFNPNPWSIERLLLPKRLFKRGPYGAQDVFTCGEILHLMDGTKYGIDLDPLEVQRVRNEQQKVRSNFGSYHVALAQSTARNHVRAYAPSNEFILALSAFVRAYAPKHELCRAEMTNRFSDAEVLWHPLYLEVFLDRTEEFEARQQ